MTDLTPVLEVILNARRRFTHTLLDHTAKTGATIEIYHRYLSMQYHLTKGVQRYFLAAASHAALCKMRRLRRFLYDFANEEELHYLVAANDLVEMGLEILGQPFDVELWHAYFTQEVVTRPFLRLGAAAVLENLAGTENRSVLSGLLHAAFLSPKNTKFLVLHMHQGVPHGDQILAALTQEDLHANHLADLVEGAQKGTILYLRMVDWAVNADALSRMLDEEKMASLSTAERARIGTFSMTELLSEA